MHTHRCAQKWEDKVAGRVNIKVWKGEDKVLQNSPRHVKESK